MSPEMPEKPSRYSTRDTRAVPSPSDCSTARRRARCGPPPRYPSTHQPRVNGASTPHRPHSEWGRLTGDCGTPPSPPPRRVPPRGRRRAAGRSWSSTYPTTRPQCAGPGACCPAARPRTVPPAARRTSAAGRLRHPADCAAARVEPRRARACGVRVRPPPASAPHARVRCRQPARDRRHSNGRDRAGRQDAGARRSQLPGHSRRACRDRSPAPPVRCPRVRRLQSGAASRAGDRRATGLSSYYSKKGTRILRTMSLRARLLASLCLALFVTIGCGGEPPDKEMQQAQGAVDAARAAGADKYATEEFAAATLALNNARDAVAQRDYRLALNHALDSRERAQNAAKMAADGKASARTEADRAITTAQNEINAAKTKIDGT